MTQDLTNLARDQRWRCALLDAVEPCPACGRLILLTSRGSPWDLSGHDARIVAKLRGIDPADKTLGEGISRPHACPRALEGARTAYRGPPHLGSGRREPDIDSEAGGASRWEAHINLWAVRVAKRAKQRRGLPPILTCRELDAILP